MRPIHTNEVTLPLSPLSTIENPNPTQEEKVKIAFEQERLLRQPETMADAFMRENENEIAFVTGYFQQNPSETQLHAHHRGMQIVYHDTKNNPITLQHTYFFWENILYVKVARKHLAGLGKFNRVKYLLDLTNKKWVVMRVNLELSPLDHINIQQKPTRFLAQLQKKPNPFKQNRQTQRVVLQQFCGLDLFYISHIVTQSTHDYSALLQLPFLMVLALEKFHQGAFFNDLNGKKMVHCDIKPENLTLTFESGKPHVHPIDDDHAVVENNEGEYTATVLCHTKDYSPPELKRHDKRANMQCNFDLIPEELSVKKNRRGEQYAFLYTPQSDIFALGESIRRIAGAFRTKFTDQTTYLESIRTICVLMKYAHPHSRPSLSILKYVFFFLYWHHVLKQAPEFSDALAAEKITAMPLEKIQLITSIYFFAASTIKITSLKAVEEMKGINRAIESDTTTISELQSIRFRFEERKTQARAEKIKTATPSMQP